MSLYEELREEAAEILGDPEFRQEDIVLIREAITPPAKPWEEPLISHQYFALDAVSAVQRARYSAGTLVTERRIRVTVSAYCSEIAEDGSVIQSGVVLTPLESDTIRIGGRERRVMSIIPVPPSGPTVVWKIEVSD